MAFFRTFLKASLFLICFSSLAAAKSSLFDVTTVGLLSKRRAAAASDTLTNSIVAYWKLEESSGNSRADATGNGHTLTDNNMVDSDTGVIGNQAKVTLAVGNRYLSRNGSDVAMQLSGDFTIDGYITLFGLTDNVTAVGKFEGGDTHLEYTFAYEPGDDPLDLMMGGATGRFVAYIVSYNDDGMGNTNYMVNRLVCDTFGAPSIGPVYYFNFGLSGSDFKASINGGSEDVMTVSDALNTSDQVFCLFCDNPNSQFAAAKIDEVGRWNRYLTPTEIARRAAKNAGSRPTGY